MRAWGTSIAKTASPRPIMAMFGERWTHLRRYSTAITVDEHFTGVLKRINSGSYQTKGMR